MMMNKHLIERFKKGKVAINLETQQEWNEFMQWLEENTDLRWNTGHKPTEKNYWNVDKEWTCVDSDMAWSAYNSYEGSGYEIIKYKDLKEGKGMKTSEFIKRAKEYAFVEEENGVIILHKDGITVGEVSTDYHNDYKITWIASEEEENLIREYAKTPIEEREEEEKYYIRPKGMRLENENVMNYSSNYGDWFQDNKHEGSQFTLKELEGLGIDVEHYDLEVVE